VSEHESYERLRASLDDAYEQADRLVREAEAQARENAHDGPPGVAELQALTGLFDLARQSVPPELARQVLDALRQLLLAIRALIDYYIERLDRERETPPEVEDIPIQ
jgi:hypothetical protein